MSTSRALTPVAEVCQAIKRPEFQEQLKAALPEGVTLDRFTRVLLNGLQQNQDIVNKDRTSLYMAIAKCAADGLMPDGREAALVAYGDKVQYMPMVGGIIKRLAQGGIVIDTQVVCTNDKFTYRPGIDEVPQHEPDWFGDRGAPKGVWAVARLPDGNAMVEIMNMDQIEAVRAVSRAKDKGPWVNWWGEMARKTVARRLAKRLPILDPKLRDLITADDELTDLDQPAPDAPVATGGRPRALAIVAAQAPKQDATVDEDGTVIDPPADDADVSLG